MTNLVIDCLKRVAYSVSPNRGLTPIEIQRWEDDGGAILADAALRTRSAERHLHLHRPVGELAAAE